MADSSKIDGRKRNLGKASNLTNAGKGRPKGAKNKATADLMAIAGEYTAEAVVALVNVIRSTESDSARVSAIKELLDRAHGKATQSIDANIVGDLSDEMKAWLGKV